MTLYVSDLDGTLLGRDEKLSGFTVRTLNALISRGMKFTYATARSNHSAVQVTEGLTKKLPVIVYNGAFILDGAGGPPLLQSGFDAQQTRWVREHAARFDLWPVVYAFVDGIERLSWVAGRETEGQSHYLQSRQGDRRLRPVRTLDELFAGETFYSTFIGEKERLAPLYELASGCPWLTATFQQDLYREEYWLELMPKAATKAHAAAELKRLLGCGKMVAFGDAINDLPLFAAADVSCAVANAVPELKAVADHIIGGNDQDGVAKWLLENFDGKGVSNP